MAEHDTLTDPKIHEPKGVSTASNGDVYVANGAGSGVWTSRKSFSVSPAYGEIYFVGNATSTSLTVQGTFYQVAGTYGTNLASGITASTTGLTIVTPGIYQANWSASVTQGSAGGDDFDFALAINGSPSSVKVRKYVNNDNNDATVSLSTLLDLNASDVVYAMVSNQDAASTSLVVTHSTLNLRLIKED